MNYFIKILSEYNDSPTSQFFLILSSVGMGASFLSIVATVITKEYAITLRLVMAFVMFWFGGTIIYNIHEKNTHVGD